MNEMNLKGLEILDSLQEKLINVELAVKSGKMSETDAVRHLKFMVETAKQVSWFAPQVAKHVEAFKDLAKGTLEKVQSAKLP